MELLYILPSSGSIYVNFDESKYLENGGNIVMGTRAFFAVAKNTLATTPKRKVTGIRE